MPRVDKSQPEDFRRVLREKALNHSLFYLKLGAGVHPHEVQCASRGHKRVHSAPVRTLLVRRDSNTLPPTTRVSELVKRFEPIRMQYLRLPRPASPAEDITSSDEEDRSAVRRRSRDLSDDSAVELEPRPRRHSHPRNTINQAITPRRETTLLEARDIELRRGSEDCEGRARCVRTPSVVVSDYSDGIVIGATAEEADWLRSRSLSADSACSSCSTLSSRDDEEFDTPVLQKKMVNAD